jgi:hypothetical protein
MIRVGEKERVTLQNTKENYYSVYSRAMNMNLTLIDSNNNDSLFDSIRHYDNQGNEFWSARELMVVMGYTRWENFETAIASATENLELAGDVVYQHFRSKVKKSKGRPSLDYELTRYGCYMTALSCDGRKSEVALAKKYFAIKAREAEVIIPQQNDRIRELEMQLEISRNQKYILDKSEAIASLHGVGMLALFQGRPDAVVEVKEKVTETMICIEGRTVSFVGKSTAELAKELGFKTGRELEAWLTRNHAEHLICQGMRAVQSPYIPEENIKEVKRLFSIERNKTQRQLLIGE